MRLCSKRVHLTESQARAFERKDVVRKNKKIRKSQRTVLAVLCTLLDASVNLEAVRQTLSGQCRTSRAVCWTATEIRGRRTAGERRGRRRGGRRCCRLSPSDVLCCHEIVRSVRVVVSRSVNWGVLVWGKPFDALGGHVREFCSVHRGIRVLY